MNSKIIIGLFVIVGIINFLPIMGITSTNKLERLYGITVSSAEIEILLRHRALLFGLVGGFIIYAAFKPHLHNLAFVAAYLSMIGYIALTKMAGPTNDQIAKVATIDWIALALLSLALLLKLLGSRGT